MIANTYSYGYEFVKVIILWGGGNTRWRSWLRQCATDWKVAGSIPDGMSGIFHWPNPSGHTMALGSTVPLTQMSTTSKAAGV